LRIACGARSPCARGVALLTYHHHRVISTSPPSREQPRAPAWLAPGFFLSGAAALIYQVVWQRVLFASFGINVEAVTVVVTAFLFGLGIGSVVGGELARSPTRPPLLLFGTIELLIGAFGVTSVGLYRATAVVTAGWSPAATAALTFALVFAPTLLMGATLPLLVAYLVRIEPNVGRSVGLLYFVNTAGSSVAALLAAVFVLGAFGESGTVRIAALLNAAVASLAFISYTRSRTTA